MRRVTPSYSALALTIGRVLAGIFGLATVIVLSRLLSKQDYGTYQQVLLVFNIASPFLLLGLPAGVSYFIPQFDVRRQKMVVVQTALLLAVAGLLISLGTYLFADLIAIKLKDPGLAPLLRLFFWFPIFILPLAFVDSFLVATYRARAAGWFNLVSSLVQFGAAVVPIAMGYHLRTVMVALDASAFARFVGYGYYVMRGFRGVPLLWDVGFIKRLFHYSVPLGVSSIVGTLTPQFDRIVISHLFGPKELAVYVNGATELPLVGIVAGSVMTVITPEFVRLFVAGDHTEMLRLWHSATRKVALLFFPVTAFLMVFATSAVIVLFSALYLDSTPLFRIFLLLLPLRITAYGSLLMVSGRSSLILKAAVGTLILNAILVCTFTPLLGLVGAAISTVFAVYTMAAWQLYHCKSLLQVPWRSILPWHDLAEIMLMAMLAAAIAWGMTLPFHEGGLRTGIGLILFTAVTGALMWRHTGMRAEIVGLSRTVRQRNVASGSQLPV